MQEQLFEKMKIFYKDDFKKSSKNLKIRLKNRIFEV